MKLVAASIQPRNPLQERDLFASVNRVDHEPIHLDEDGVIFRSIDRFLSMWLSGLAAGLLFAIDWSGGPSCCRVWATFPPFADMWWHFFAFWAISWPFVALGMWFYEE